MGVSKPHDRRAGGGRRPQERAGRREHAAAREDLPRRICLAGAAALFVASPLLPLDAPPREGMAVVTTTAWLVLMLAWLLIGLVRAELPFRVSWFDAALLAFLAAHTLSAIVMAKYGSPRASINALWQTLGMGAAFFLTRQLAIGPAERRALCAVMIGLAAGLAVYGFYQYAVELPQTRAAYERDPDAALRQAGIDAPPGSPERNQFHNRLMQSFEPIATFALANSLAGFLVPWLLIALGLAIDRWRSGDLSEGRWAPIGAAICALLIGFCLLLTKSRSAALAATIGILVLAAMAVWRQRAGRKTAAIAAAALLGVGLVLIGLAAAIGALDSKVATEAIKSFTYRLEYWQAALAMMADYPLLGCGPGNFQDYYTFYKPPQGSETVADPHNFVLEIGASAGILSLTAWMIFLGVWLWKARPGFVSSSGQKPGATPQRGESPAWVIGGAAFGVLSAVPLSLLIGRTIGGAALALALAGCIGAAAVLRPWIRSGRLPQGVLLIALGGLFLNLLAAGGVGFPNVAGSLWLLMALAASAAEGARAPRMLSRRSAGLAALAAVAIVMACLETVYRPVLNAEASLQAAEQDESLSLDHRAELLAKAAKADPFAAEPWRHLAALHLSRYLDGEDERDREAFESAVEAMLRRERRSSGLRLFAGDMHLAAWRKTRQRAHLTAAARAYSQAVALYPNSSFAHAQFAWSLHLAGKKADARREANEALRLDRINPHRELDLKNRAVFTGLSALGGRPGAAVPEDAVPESTVPEGEADANAEQLMQRLRTGAGELRLPRVE